MATEVKIKIRAFPYYEDVTDPVTGDDRKVEKIATRGQVVELNDADLERAKRFDAIADPDEETPSNQSLGATPDLTSASVEELSSWLKGEYEDQTSKPTIDDVKDAVDDDEELAERFVQAENLATGGQPRAGLVEAMGKVGE